ncbi:PTS sugar transporter [Kocuria coralli]|uniref:Ascorbate-specific PTS system EIIA component n=1 Tax=Kocuria coralli TaxID=1461025 RepID=A0A5J5KZ58_9MICC|nr:PTS sugar transporter subunit IIA [Kocuria coralli]KAA9394842.1 PTS sugar transporter [Kocuria coralli]
MATLHELVTPDSIRLDAEAGSWQEAVRASGELLVSAGVSDDSYTESMIRNVEENGPYIVVAPGFAFAHARAEDDIHRTGMSWVRLREPVAFGHESNDPVSLIAALAAPDSTEHMQAMRQLATLLGKRASRQALDEATTTEQFHAALDTGKEPEAQAARPAPATAAGAAGGESSRSARKTKDHILTVCGNGLGTSLFLKNTLEQVLDQWGWSPYLTVEATDTISARGKSKDADLIMTSGEIARTLGDVGIPVKVISNFTSTEELDAALRDSYDV